MQYDDEDDDDDDDDTEEEDEDADFNGGMETFLGDFGGERKALILSDETRSYSSMRLARSSSEVMETRASRSSEGNWQRKCLTEAPQSSSSFSNSSIRVRNAN